MRRNTAMAVLFVGLGVLLLGVAAVGTGLLPVPAGLVDGVEDTTPLGSTPSPPDDGYDRTTVTVVDEDGATLGRVEVRVADTHEKRYLGLSNTSSMAEDEGMLFVYGESGDHAYVMRNMSFPLDIVYVGADGRITSIHHAPVPPEGTPERELERYRGTGRYVLEVNRGWAADHDVEVGDEVRIANVSTSPSA